MLIFRTCTALTTSEYSDSIYSEMCDRAGLGAESVGDAAFLCTASDRGTPPVVWRRCLHNYIFVHALFSQCVLGSRFRSRSPRRVLRPPPKRRGPRIEIMYSLRTVLSGFVTESQQAAEAGHNAILFVSPAGSAPLYSLRALGIALATTFRTDRLEKAKFWLSEH